MTVGLRCPSHSDTAFNVQAALRSQWRAQLWRRLPGRLKPVPASTVTRPAFYENVDS